MKIEVLKSKIHRVKVTGADINYIGSISIDKLLMEASNIIVGEKVQLLNVTNGERLETYVITGEKGSGDIFINGPAAKKISKGDEIIIVSYALVDFIDAKSFKPTVIFPKEGNSI
tara:strand:+ start:17930 stop:18274 length:345 start_codon:yes stop_codon:yes gene_type:complete